MLHLLDPVTQLPHYLALMPSLERILREDGALGVLLLGVQGLDRVEEVSGPKVFDEIMRCASKSILDMRGKLIRQEDLLAVTEIGGTSLVLFLSQRRQDRDRDGLKKNDVEMVADRVQEALYPSLLACAAEYSRHHPQLTVGYSFVVHNPLIRDRRLIYRLIDDAKEMARLQQPRSELKTKERLQRIILEENVTTLFQPIFDLKTSEVMGYEALTRGPVGTIFELPIMLFSLARKSGLVFELDRLCRRKALENARMLPSDCKIFVNTLPNTIHDPEFRGKYLKDFLHDIQKKPENIVFEINERAAIENFSMFRDAMKYYIDLGVSIAVDDIGTGYSTLEAIVELSPRYLKLDIAMIEGVAQSRVKQELVRMLLTLATNIGAETIAEGIETEEDLVTLKKLGVQHGQGFYFARPMTVDALLDSPSSYKQNSNRS